MPDGSAVARPQADSGSCKTPDRRPLPVLPSFSLSGSQCFRVPLGPVAINNEYSSPLGTSPGLDKEPMCLCRRSHHVEGLGGDTVWAVTKFAAQGVRLKRRLHRYRTSRAMAQGYASWPNET